MWRAGTWYAPYSMYMYVYTGHLLCGEQALGRHLIVCIYWALAMWRAGTWYIPYSMYMYVYTGHLLCGGQALGRHLIVCICMYILGTCYVEGRHLIRTL